MSFHQFNNVHIVTIASMIHLTLNILLAIEDKSLDFRVIIWVYWLFLQYYLLLLISHILLFIYFHELYVTIATWTRWETIWIKFICITIVKYPKKLTLREKKKLKKICAKPYQYATGTKSHTDIGMAYAAVLSHADDTAILGSHKNS